MAMGRKKSVVVQGHYREDGTYVQPHTRIVESAIDEGRVDTVRGSDWSPLDGLEEGDPYYSDHIAGDSWDMDIQDVDFGPNGLLNNTSRWDGVPAVRNAHVDGSVKFLGESTIEGGSYAGELTTMRTNLNNNRFGEGSKVDVRGCDWRDVSVRPGGDVFSSGVDMDNVKFMGMLRVEKHGSINSPDNSPSVTNTRIASTKGKGGEVSLNKSTVDNSAIKLGGGSRMSLRGVNLSDSYLQVPPGKSVSISQSDGSVARDIQDAQVMGRKGINGDDDNVCLVVAREKGSSTPQDSLYVYSSIGEHKMTLNEDGDYAPETPPGVPMWQNGMSPEKATRMLSKAASDYAKRVWGQN